MRALIQEIDAVPRLTRFGRVARIEGLLVEVTGAAGAISLGAQLRLSGGAGKQISCEVVGFRDGRALAMPLGSLDGMTLSARADFEDRPAVIYPSTAWLGRVLDAFARPQDGRGLLPQGAEAYPIKAQAPVAHARERVGAKLDLGVRALNAFATCCKGQRMGIFSGSGVGKSTLLAMLARNTEADAIVIGLIGERGREVKEFIEDDLGPEGLARSVVVAASSDEPPLVRRQAAYVAMTVAEQLRDQGLHVLLLMDSVTRFAMAQREVGLSAGEPPAQKGYTPTVFAELPRLLERAGPGPAGCTGSITGLFTVLVEGDDHNEPIADAVRGILDGHIVLERSIAERGRFPAINVLKSVSRAMPGCNSAAEQHVVAEARAPLALYDDMADLIRLGAYKQGTNAQVDRAIALHPALEAFLAQKKDEQASFAESYTALENIVGAEGKGRVP
ncbi:MAG: flagellar protein export ATPase FliI [Alphaproteobacteria bacterium]|nr:flagellar protein export ATPase FliI [Alphaproteobacteria bacterium]MBV9694052.1 flagellar protein export ATPase FliI [Alphaproteobacteria bacterium]